MMHKWIWDNYIQQWWCHSGMFYGTPEIGDLVEINGIQKEYK